MYVIKRGDEVFRFQNIGSVTDFICHNIKISTNDANNLCEWALEYLEALAYEQDRLLEENILPLAAKYGLTIEEVGE